MSIHVEDKESFTVLGKLGQGLSNEGHKWIPPLWQEANKNFYEISAFALKDSEGNLVGLWGAMSDVNENFERWTDQGKYLAGCEALANSIAPEGWTKWNIPSYKYAVIQCNQDTYQEKFNYMLKKYIPGSGYSIVGAVHEYYKPNVTDGSLYLYFPIERKE